MKLIHGIDQWELEEGYQVTLNERNMIITEIGNTKPLNNKHAMDKPKPKKDIFVVKTREEANAIYDELKHAAMYYTEKAGFTIYGLGYKKNEMKYHDYTLIKSK